jgi:hypothetical protein
MPNGDEPCLYWDGERQILVTAEYVEDDIDRIRVESRNTPPAAQRKRRPLPVRLPEAAAVFRFNDDCKVTIGDTPAGMRTCLGRPNSTHSKNGKIQQWFGFRYRYAENEFFTYDVLVEFSKGRVSTIQVSYGP